VGLEHDGFDWTEPRAEMPPRSKTAANLGAAVLARMAGLSSPSGLPPNTANLFLGGGLRVIDGR
jgi:hypothetical protein